MITVADLARYRFESDFEGALDASPVAVVSAGQR
jgi:hypothetical protein